MDSCAKRPTKLFCFFIAATSIPVAGRKQWSYSRLTTSPFSRGTRAGMDDRPGERGSAKNFADVVKDVDALSRHISKSYGIALENMIVLAHSVGAVTVAAWVHDYAPPIRAMILATAAFRVRLYVPFAVPACCG